MWLLARFELLSISHDNLNSLEVLSAGTHPLHQLQVFALHVLVSLRHLVILKSQLKYLLTG